MEFIKRLQQYITIDEDIHQFLLDNVQEISIQKKELLSSCESKNQNIYVVEQGILRMFYNQDGKEMTTNFYTEGALLGNIDTIFKNIPTSLNIEAIESSRLYALDYNKLEELCETSLIVSNFTRKVLGVLMVEMVKRITTLQYMTAKQRYYHLLKEKPSIIQRAPLGMIASYLGISQETLSRIRTH